MICGHYAKRSAIATPNAGFFATQCGLADFRESASYRAMFDRYRFLSEILEKAGGKQAEVGRVLGLPSSRLSELFNPEAAKPRKLKLEEAVKLSEAFGVPITGHMASAESLLPVLKVCLRYAPKEWTEQELRRLSEEIELGLRLQQSLGPSQDDPNRRPPAPGGEVRPSPDERD